MFHFVSWLIVKKNPGWYSVDHRVSPEKCFLKRSILKNHRVRNLDLKGKQKLLISPNLDKVH